MPFTPPPYRYPTNSKEELVIQEVENDFFFL